MIKNRTKIRDKIEKHQDNPNYVLTYHSRRRNETRYKCFTDKQTADAWASKNKKPYTFIQIWPQEEVESDDLTTTDLMDDKIDLTDPSTENVLYEKNGMFHTGWESDKHWCAIGIPQMHAGFEAYSA